MKLILLIHVVAVTFIYSCNSIAGKDDIQSFIPGTYIRFSQHEYGTEFDTLVISLQNRIAGEYSIVRKWKYERKLDGRNIEPEYKRTKTSGIYDNSQKLLKETQSGETFSFDPDQNTLFVGYTKYKKI